MKRIELTEQEAQVLLNLLDIAVRARGLEAAEAALVLARKVKEAEAVEEDVSD